MTIVVVLQAEADCQGRYYCFVLFFFFSEIRFNDIQQKESPRQTQMVNNSGPQNHKNLSI